MLHGVGGISCSILVHRRSLSVCLCVDNRLLKEMVDGDEKVMLKVGQRSTRVVACPGIDEIFYIATPPYSTFTEIWKPGSQPDTAYELLDILQEEKGSSHIYTTRS